jgi:amino-acid N-acetyltransferase
LIAHQFDRWTGGRGAAAGSPGLPVLGRSALQVERVDPRPVEIRPARISDMRAVEPMIRAFANDNLMLPKSTDQLARTFREFVVAADEAGTVIGCGALRIYNENLAEVCSLAVDLPYQGFGVGRKLVDRLVDEARGLQVKTVFALTLRPDFFERAGFRVVAKERFPLKVWADCRSCPKLHACDEIAVALDT